LPLPVVVGGSVYYVIFPARVIRPILLVSSSTNHMSPSGAVVIRRRPAAEVSTGNDFSPVERAAARGAGLCSTRNRSTVGVAATRGPSGALEGAGTCASGVSAYVGAKVARAATGRRRASSNTPGR